VKITASLPGSVDYFSVQDFITRLSGVLGIPTAAVEEVIVDLDRSTSTVTILQFMLVSVNCIDPVAKARQLKTMIEANDPLLGQYQLSGLQIISSEENAEVSAATLLHFMPNLCLLLAVILLFK
jgi:hypothetical protein